MGYVHRTPKRRYGFFARNGKSRAVQDAIHADAAPLSVFAGLSNENGGRPCCHIVFVERRRWLAENEEPPTVACGDRFLWVGTNQRAGLRHGDVAGIGEGGLLALVVDHQGLHTRETLMRRDVLSSCSRAEAQGGWCVLEGEWAASTHAIHDMGKNSWETGIPAQGFKDAFFCAHFDGEPFTAGSQKANRYNSRIHFFAMLNHCTGVMTLGGSTRTSV